MNSVVLLLSVDVGHCWCHFCAVL